jgi:hypothetical protein
MIDQIGDFLQHNLVVLLAVVLVPMKWVVLRICGDTEAQAVALLSIPEDICYVTLGLILGDVASSTGAFRKQFHASTHPSIDIFVTGMFNVVVAILVHFFAKHSNDHFKSWRAASSVRLRAKNSPGFEQLELPMATTDENFQTIQIRHLAVFSLLYALQLALSIWWLSWITKILSNV